MHLDTRYIVRKGRAASKKLHLFQMHLKTVIWIRVQKEREYTVIILKHIQLMERQSLHQRSLI